MINCILVDDEKLAREELKYLLKDYEGITIVGEGENALEALKLVEELRVDLIFLDIKMPKISGMELARILMDRKNCPGIVFVTAYDQFALEAFQVNAIDYLLKPIDRKELARIMEKKVYSLRESVEEEEEKMEKLLNYMDRNRDEGLNKLTVHHKDRMIPLNFKDIIYISVEDKNTIVRTGDNKYFINSTLNDIYEKLDSRKFFRCHKSFIVNLDYISSIEPWFNATFNLRMKHIDEVIPLSRSHAKEFKCIMNMD